MRIFWRRSGLYCAAQSPQKRLFKGGYFAVKPLSDPVIFPTSVCTYTLKAWIWQDEWFGLTMEDIRAIERETADLLRKTMAEGNGELDESEMENADTSKAQFSSIGKFFAHFLVKYV